MFNKVISAKCVCLCKYCLFILLIGGLCLKLTSAQTIPDTRSSQSKFEYTSSDTSQNDYSKKVWKYYFGDGVVSDDTRVLALFKKAANKGHANDQYQLGIAYITKSAGSINLEESRFWLNKALSSGQPDAGMLLGMLYAEGIGVQKNPEKSQGYYNQAIKIYKQQAFKNDSHAFEVLSKIYLHGYGVAPDLKRYEEYKDKFIELVDPEKNLPASRAIVDLKVALKLTANHSDYANNHTAFNLVRSSAEKGLIDAIRYLGSSYLSGIGVDEDPHKGLDWLLRASALGDGLASYQIANIYEDGDGVPVNREWAQIFYKRARLQLNESEPHSKNAMGTYLLGVIYHYGLGVKADSELSKTYFNKACRKEMQLDCPDLSDRYINKNYGSGGRLWIAFQRGLAEAKNDPASQVALIGFLHSGYLGKRDPEKAAELAQKLLSRNNASAELLMAHYYRFGSGVKRDVNKSIDLFNKLLKQGNIGAYHALGDIYRLGDGVSSDSDKANMFYERIYQLTLGVEQNESFPYADLAYINLHGLGIKKNISKALELYSKGAVYEQSDSLTGLARMYLDGIGVERDYKKSFKFLKRAYKNADGDKQFDYGEAATYLAVSYLDGKGVAADYKKAFELFEEGAVMKYPESLYRLGTLYEFGLGVTPDVEKAREYYQQACERRNEKACEALKNSNKTSLESHHRDSNAT